MIHFSLIYSSLVLILIASAISWGAIRVSIVITQKFGIIDYPGTAPHKQHTKPTPLGGGIGLVATILAFSMLAPSLFTGEIVNILLSGTLVFAVALIDDLKWLNPQRKFLAQLLAAILVIWSGIRVDIIHIGGTETSLALNWAVSILWIVGITNAFNLIDSIDGLATSLSAISFTLLFVGSSLAGQAQLANIALIVLTFCLVFLYFNFPPAKLFLGDSGAQTIGFILACFLIQYNPLIVPLASSWFVPITFVAIPIFDVCLVFFSRIRRDRSPFRPDLYHTYHRLSMLGLDKVRAVFVLDFIAFVVGGLGLLALYQAPLAANAIFVCLVCLGVIAFFYLEHQIFGGKKDVLEK